MIKQANTLEEWIDEALDLWIRNHCTASYTEYILMELKN